MLLSYHDLVRLVQENVIDAPHEHINGASIDLTLAPDILLEDASHGYVVDVSRKQSLNMRKETIGEDGFLLYPHQCILASSNELFNLPSDITAQFFLKSSIGRVFLNNMMAGHCLIGETKIPLLNGETVNISDLCGISDVYVYSIDKTGEVVPGKVIHCGITSFVKDTIKVTLDSGDSFECTPDHRIMLRNGEYIEASLLRANDSVMPFKNRQKMSDIAKSSDFAKSLKKYRENNPIVPGRSSNSLTALFERSINRLVKKGIPVREDTYVENLIKSSPSINSIKNMYGDFDSALRAINYLNHKVVSTEIIRRDTEIPVYDLTVDRYHNFAISSGVFVHNCDPGFHNSRLTLELQNCTEGHVLLLRAGMKIGQVVFSRVKSVPHENSYAVRGRYNNTTIVTASKGV